MRKEGFGYVLTCSYTCFLTACRSNGFFRNPVRSVIQTSNLYSRGSRRLLQYIILTWRPGFTFPLGPCMNTHLCKVILQGKYKNTPPSQIFLSFLAPLDENYPSKHPIYNYVVTERVLKQRSLLVPTELWSSRGKIFRHFSFAGYPSLGLSKAILYYNALVSF